STSSVGSHENLVVITAQKQQTIATVVCCAQKPILDRFFYARVVAIE
ncbi:MAG: hypothetical protein ACI9C4_000350, partial [Paraglaciecola sp.]